MAAGLTAPLVPVVPHAVARAQPAAPVQTAASLLDGAGYGAALGATVLGPEDDGGGVAADGSQLTTARVARTDGLQYTVSLRAYAQPALAATAYETEVQPLPPADAQPFDAGERSAAAGQLAVVLQGAQLLDVSMRITGDAEAQLESAKASGGDTTALLQADDATVPVLARALAAALTGAAVTAPGVIVPEAGVDACAGEPDLAQRLLGPEATSLGPTSAERPPATACAIGLSAGTVLLSVVTAEQLATAIEPSTLDAQYAADLAAVQAAGGAEVSGIGELAFTATAPEVRAEVLVSGPSGTRYLVTAVVPGSFGQPGREAAVAASLGVLVGAVPAAAEAPTSPTTVPGSSTSATSPTSSSVPTAAGSGVATAAAPASRGAAPSVGSGSSGGGATVVVIVGVALTLLVAAGAAAARRRSRVVAAVAPRVRGVPGAGRSEVRDLEGAWSIGVRAVHGAAQHEVEEDRSDG
jgi:hypothetical protein